MHKYIIWHVQVANIIASVSCNILKYISLSKIISYLSFPLFTVVFQFEPTYHDIRLYSTWLTNILSS